MAHRILRTISKTYEVKRRVETIGRVGRIWENPVVLGDYLCVLYARFSYSTSQCKPIARWSGDVRSYQIILPL